MNESESQNVSRKGKGSKNKTKKKTMTFSCFKENGEQKKQKYVLRRVISFRATSNFRVSIYDSVDSKFGIKKYKKHRSAKILLKQRLLSR